MTEQLATKETLRGWIRTVWNDINLGRLTFDAALETFDALHAEELKGLCRGEILDILDKAAAKVGGDKPRVTDKEDGQAFIPSALVKVPAPGDGEELPRRASNILQMHQKPANIIQLPTGV